MPVTHNPTPDDYERLDAMLKMADLEVSASELHGAIYGACCGMGAEDAARTVMALLAHDDDLPLQASLVHEIEVLSGDAYRALDERQSDIALVLPPETADLGERAAALADWCRGFVLGLYQSGLRDPAALPGDTAEVARDMVEIAAAEVSGDDERGEEWALAEIEEYVRVGVQLIFEELRGTGPVSDNTGHDD